MEQSRKIYAQGSEHKVLAPNYSSATYLLKVPRLNVSLTMLLLGIPSEKAQQRVTRNTTLVEKTKILIPKTRIFITKQMGWRTPYILAVEKLIPDRSIPNVRSYVEQNSQENPLLRKMYESNPSNFICQAGQLYYVDLPQSILYLAITRFVPVDELTFYTRLVLPARRSWSVVKSLGQRLNIL